MKRLSIVGLAGWVCCMAVATANAQIVPGSDLRPVYRYYAGDPVFQHYYTASFLDRGCGSGGYGIEGVIGYVWRTPQPGTVSFLGGYAFTTQVPGTVPVFRWFSPEIGDTIFTSSPSETFPPDTYTFQGISAYIYGPPPDAGLPCIFLASVAQPNDGDIVRLSESNYRVGLTNLQANVPGSLATWRVISSYSPSGGSATLTTAPGGLATTVGYGVVGSFAFVGVGGQTNVRATCETCDVLRTITVTGPVGSPSIPEGPITAQLCSIYSGATPGLLTLIAQQESSYRQFASRTLYNVTANWPLENFATNKVTSGEYIGLMMVPVAMDTAFDWVANTVKGNTILAEKFAFALQAENAIRAKYAGLRALTEYERENMALVFYFGAASLRAPKIYTSQYYEAACMGGGKGSNCTGGFWDWEKGDNKTGTEYVDHLRTFTPKC